MENKISFREEIYIMFKGTEFTPVFSLNHPTEDNDGVHYIYDHIRVVLYHKNGDKYFKLSYGDFRNKLNIETSKFKIDLENVYKQFSIFKSHILNYENHKL